MLGSAVLNDRSERITRFPASRWSSRSCDNARHDATACDMCATLMELLKSARGPGRFDASTAGNPV